MTSSTKYKRKQLIQNFYEPQAEESLKLKVESKMGAKLHSFKRKGQYAVTKLGHQRVISWVCLKILVGDLHVEDRIFLDFETYSYGSCLARHTGIEDTNKPIPFVVVVRATDGDWYWKFSPADDKQNYAEISGIGEALPLLSVAIPRTYFKEFK